MDRYDNAISYCKLNNGKIFIIVKNLEVADRFLKKIKLLANDLTYKVANSNTVNKIIKAQKREDEKLKKELKNVEQELKNVEQELLSVKNEIRNLQKDLNF
jgi:septal ring factor EnvC (AmiA/AmiB activator)